MNAQEQRLHYPLGEALHLLRLTGCVYARSALTAPWGVELPPLEGHMMFHIVTAGRLWLEADGIDPLLLERGSLALVPHGLGHRLVDERGREAVPFFDLPVERVTERCVVLNFGKKISEGSYREVAADRQVQEAYLRVE